MQQQQSMHVSSAAQPIFDIRRACQPCAVMNAPRQEATPPKVRLMKGRASWAQSLPGWRKREKLSGPALGSVWGLQLTLPWALSLASTCAKALARSYWGSRGMPGVFAHLLCRLPRGVLCSLGLQGVRPADAFYTSVEALSSQRETSLTAVSPIEVASACERLAVGYGLPKDGHLVHCCVQGQCLYHFMGSDGKLKARAMLLV